MTQRGKQGSATDPDVFDINLDELSIEEIEQIEETLGGAIDAVFAEGKPKGKAMRVLAWVVKRRDNPAFTLEEAGKLRIRLVEEPAGPTDAAG